nr:uncharacterized protein LOC123773975 isoform X1 [Procambarus clarkii]
MRRRFMTRGYHYLPLNSSNMELDSDDILNEVDELLSKLDKLPDDVRLQALKKLSQKVSAPRLRGGRGGRGRGRGPSRYSGTPLLIDNQPNVNIKKENEISAESDEPEMQKTSQEGVLSECQEENGEVTQKEEKPKSVKKKLKVIPENTIIKGRRHTKKVDYRQLAEFGHGDEIKEEEEEEVQAENKPQSIFHVKRGRGRPRKYPPVVREAPVTNTDQCSPPVLLCDSQISEKCTTQSKTDETGNGENPGISETDQGNGFDLLESCLKESGIKAVDSERRERQMTEQQVREKESEPNSVDGLVKCKEEPEDVKSEVQNVYVCDTVEAVDNVPKKKTVKSQYKCEECGKMYSTMSILKTHQVRHRDKADLPFKCAKCDFSAASKIELFRHSYKHTDTQLYICEICGNTFSRDTSLREHIEYVHAKSRRLKCALCNFVTHRRTTIRNHMLTHEGARPIIACPVCGVTFRSKRNLRAHLYSHAGAKPFACEECGKKFIMKNRLAAHILQVHGPRRHNCPHCIKCFPTIHHLRRHVRIHTGEKPYKCCFCAFTCNTQGNLIKHIRQVHDRLNFTYKDFLRECGKEQQGPEVDDQDLEKMSKEGRELAQKLLPTLAEWTCQTLTVDQLKEQVQKERDSKVAALQEQQARRKRRILRKGSSSVKPSSYYNEPDGKITLYALAGDTYDGTPIVHPMDENITVEAGLSGLGDNQYLHYHYTDDSGCVMMIPWDMSLIGESEEGEEEGEWTQHTLHEDRIVKSNSAEDDVVTIKVPKSNINLPSIVTDNNISNLASSLEMGNAAEQEKSRANTSIQVSDNVIQVSNLGEVVGELDPANVKGAVRAAINVDVLPKKKFCKQLPESIQVIASNEPVDDTVPNASNFVLPEGYIVDDDGQVIQLTDNVIDTNLLLRQMGQVVRGADASEVTINKITSNVYSLMSQGSDGQEGETFVITTQNGEDGEEEEDEDNSHSYERMERSVARVDLLPVDDEDDRQSALVLIVNAEDLENS